MTNYECENRISDDEIISSLEVIATTRNCSECKIRNCNWGDCNCSQITANAALDLINRQKTEVERLQKEVNLVSIQFQDLQERYEEAQTEIERLKKTEIEIDDFCRRLCRMRMLNGNAIASYEDLQNYIQQEKSEAVKEFAERLKKVWFDNGYESPDVDFEDFVDNLVKEMAGDTE